MAASKFKYQGPVSSVSLRVEGSDEPLEVTFFPGQEYNLPTENEHVKALVFNKFLTPVEAPKAPSRKTKSTSEEQA